jgi:hypothetical protein
MADFQPVFPYFPPFWRTAQKQNGYFVQKAKEKAVDFTHSLW